MKNARYFGRNMQMAGEERIELSITVLETAVIPLNYSPSGKKRQEVLY